jgi:hypothetical protein
LNIKSPEGGCPSSDPIAPARRFHQKLLRAGGTGIREYVAVAVPSSEGWEDVEDIHWFHGFTLSDARGQSCLVVRFPTTAGWDAADLNASLLALIELGQDALKCDQIFLALKRNPDELENLVHTLMYVGFEVDDVDGVAEDCGYLTLRYETE